MQTRTLPHKRRSGATAVETALVMIPLTMCIFGIFEYGRLLMDLNLLNNAVREGCRYALVNNTSTSINSSVQGVVTNYLAQEVHSFGNLTISVTGTHLGKATAVNDLAAGDYITVTASGQFTFMNVIPLVPMPSLTLTRSVTMVCEGVT